MTLATKEPTAHKLRLLTVSNRGPKEFHRDEKGDVTAVPGQGGLSTALSVAASLYPATWLSSPLTAIDREIADGTIAPACADGASHFVSTGPRAYELYYGCFANEVLWFLQHGMAWPEELTAEKRREAWTEGYAAVNSAFAAKIVEELDTGAYRAVMFHDYHFYWAPLLVRRQRPDVFMQHFVHIPWPEAGEWDRLEPDIVVSICEGLLANDSLVFQTPASVRTFLATCERFLTDAEVDLDSGTVVHGGRRTRVWANGISVDPAELSEAAASQEFSRYRFMLRGEPHQRAIVRVDRLDPTKNVLAGFQAYAYLLEQHPELHEKVYFLSLLVPTKSDIEIYRRHQDEARALAESINQRFGNRHWKPIQLYFEHNRVQALAAMSLYDVLLVNPVADGMNLVAKEGPMLNSHDGVLVLSRTAGAHTELGCGTISIDPHDVAGTTAALYEALMMPPAERRDRAARIRDKVRSHDLRDWFRTLLSDIEAHTPITDAGEPSQLAETSAA
ncbi:MAG: trehalose-6-phosphate synthase [Dehalococcoidia bacterium]|nr:trehalose-6-phosphate synthase [Dehalococcoidia bacterium]